MGLTRLEYGTTWSDYYTHKVAHNTATFEDLGVYATGDGMLQQWAFSDTLDYVDIDLPLASGTYM